jgi:hypothetical protein
MALPAAAAPKKAEDKSSRAVSVQSAALTGALQIIKDRCSPEDGDALSVSTYQWDAEKNVWVAAPTRLGNCYTEIGYAIDLVKTGALFAAGAFNFATDKTGNFSVWELLEQPESNETIRKFLGADLVAKRVKEANGGEFVHYNPKAFEAAFNSFYFKPTETRLGISGQQLYDSVFKKDVADVASEMARILSKKADFEKEAKTFNERLSKDPEFWGSDFAYAAANRLFPVPEGSEAEGVDSRIFGVMLRRHTDGTLPVILKSLKAVLKDYDPETFKKVSSKL